MAAGGRADGVYEFGDFRLPAAQRREYWRERGSPEGCELEAERLLVR